MIVLNKFYYIAYQQIQLNLNFISKMILLNTLMCTEFFSLVNYLKRMGTTSLVHSFDLVPICVLKITRV